jgi:2Fe-2S ferredoxin
VARSPARRATAFGLTRTSRLCCQLIISEELDGITVTLPEETHNFLLD